MPGVDTEYSGGIAHIKVNPYAATVRKGIHMMGWPSTTTNEDIQFGVYSYGAVDKNFPDSFGYSYPVSTGATTYTPANNLSIGMVKSYGSMMHISWRDDEHDEYGIDIVDDASDPATTSVWESIIFDNGFTSKEKTGLYLLASFLELPEDCSFMLKYKINRGDWIYSPELNSTNLNYPGIARFDVKNDPANQLGNRFYEAQIGIEITSGTATPTFTSIGLIFNDNRDEKLS